MGVTRLVVATGNPGKLEEVRDALGGRDLELVAAAEAGVEDVPAEEGDSYEANALIKAAHAAHLSGLPALADDSGLEVDALRGAPGLYSARYGGDLGPGERVAHLLAQLRRIPDEERSARFVCVLVLATPDGDVHSFEARCEGRILHGPRGEGGFGYDPVFFSADLGKAFGEASLEEKRRVSHRGRALAAFAQWLDSDDGRAALERTGG